MQNIQVMIKKSIFWGMDFLRISLSKDTYLIINFYNVINYNINCNKY